MKRLRLFLLPVGAICELIILLTCLVVGFLYPAVAEKIMKWATSTFPSLYWYIGDE